MAIGKTHQPDGFVCPAALPVVEHLLDQPGCRGFHIVAEDVEDGPDLLPLRRIDLLLFLKPVLGDEHAGADGADDDVRVFVLLNEIPGQQPVGSFRGAVHAHVRCEPLAIEAAAEHVVEGPRPLLSKALNRYLRAEHAALEISIDQRVHQVLGHFVHFVTRARAAGIVDPEVHAAEAGDGMVPQRLYIGLAGDIAGRAGDSCRPGRGQFADRLVHIRLLAA